jgi:hypothetical protein
MLFLPTQSPRKQTIAEIRMGCESIRKINAALPADSIHLMSGIMHVIRDAAPHP